MHRIESRTRNACFCEFHRYRESVTQKMDRPQRTRWMGDIHTISQQADSPRREAKNNVDTRMEPIRRKSDPRLTLTAF
jgi:hypothetical protein